MQSEDARRKLRANGSASVFPELALEIDGEPDASEAVDEYEAKLIADFEQRALSPSHASPCDATNASLMVM